MPTARCFHHTPCRAGLLLAILLYATVTWGETPLAERYHNLKNGNLATLPGTTISLISTEQAGLLGAEVTAILPYPFGEAAPALAKVANWCQFMPLHFNIKACTYQMEQGSERLTLYSDRKTYQAPEHSHPLVYRVESRAQGVDTLSLLLLAPDGPVGTHDYRLELDMLRVQEGTLLHIRSSYRPSLTSSLLTRSYLATLGRNKVGFTRLEQGAVQYVHGVRGVIERNVMRYYLAIATFLETRSLPDSSRRETALKRWFRLNDSYPQQLHEMSEKEYLTIKRREWKNQLRLQQTLNEQQ